MLRGDDVDQIPGELLKVGGPSALVALLFWALLKGWIVVGKVYDREVARADKLETIAENATEALRGKTNSDDLAVALLRSVERKAAENESAAGGGGAA
jgi:hypothetical protein